MYALMDRHKQAGAELSTAMALDRARDTTSGCLKQRRSWQVRNNSPSGVESVKAESVKGMSEGISPGLYHVALIHRLQEMFDSTLTDFPPVFNPLFNRYPKMVPNTDP
jgi:hypothetical protein